MCNLGLRTTPPLLTLSLPTSNWGLIKNIPSIQSPTNKFVIDLKTNFNEIKDKSATTKFGNALLLDKRSWILNFEYLFFQKE